MKVKIIKCSGDYLYKDDINEIFEVDDYKDNLYITTRSNIRGDFYVTILKADTIPVHEINLEVGDRITIEEFKEVDKYYIWNKLDDNNKIPLNTYTDARCFELDEIETIINYINKELLMSKETKMNLKEIAVRFENVEQREEIIKKFKSNGFNIADNFTSTNGEIGYSEKADYVCVLTEYGLKNRKIISYEEFIMKRLNINTCYKGKDIEVISACNGSPASISIKNKNATDVKKVFLFVSENDTTITQANAILKVMGLNYELYESTDWSKIEEGTKVTFRSNPIVDGVVIEEVVFITNCNFHSYIPKLKKIIVICTDGEAKTIDEDKVEVYRE